MIYRIQYGSMEVYNSALDGESITQGKAELDLYKAGSFTFALCPTHPAYDAIRLMRPLIVKRDDETIFFGRVIKIVSDFRKNKTFTCESELAVFNDTVQRPFSYTGTKYGLFERLINAHNDQADYEPDGEEIIIADNFSKHYDIGEVAYPLEEATFELEDYSTTLACLDRIRELYGGFFIFTDAQYGQDRQISWLSSSVNPNTQKIEFGENLLDFTRTEDAASIATGIVPLGKYVTEGEGTGSRVNISSVNSGDDFLIDDTWQGEYGMVFRIVEWPDVEEPARLLELGEAYLREHRNPPATIELTAVDLAMMDKSIEAFSLGASIDVYSYPHGIEESYVLTRQSLDLLRPEKNKIKLGSRRTGITDTVSTSTGSGPAKPAKGEWQPLTMAQGWTVSGGRTLRIKSVGSIVYMQGVPAPLADIAPGDMPSVMATGIPEECRPSQDVQYMCVGPGVKQWVCRITTAGTVVMARYGDTQYLLIEAGTALPVNVMYIAESS